MWLGIIRQIEIESNLPNVGQINSSLAEASDQFDFHVVPRDRGVRILAMSLEAGFNDLPFFIGEVSGIEPAIAFVQDFRFAHTRLTQPMNRRFTFL